METAWRLILHSLRSLRRSKGFTLGTVLTLALGIGATSATIALIQGVLLAPLPYPEPQRIVLIAPQSTDGTGRAIFPTTEQWTQWQAQADAFEAIAGYDWTFDYLILKDATEALEGLQVSKEYFNVIGVRPMLGRLFADAEIPTDHQTAGTVILGHELWERRSHGDPGIVGKAIRLSRHEPLTVIGVMPPGIRFLPSFGEEMNPNYDVNARIDYWHPVRPDLANGRGGAVHGPWSVAGRHRGGRTLEQAEVQLRVIAAKQAADEKNYQGSR